MTNLNEMRDIELTQFLVDSAGVPDEAKKSYAAGYFEGTLLSLMARYPEVRREIEDRVQYRIDQGCLAAS